VFIGVVVGEKVKQASGGFVQEFVKPIKMVVTVKAYKIFFIFISMSVLKCKP